MVLLGFAAAGRQAEEVLDRTVRDNAGKFVLIAEGAVFEGSFSAQQGLGLRIDGVLKCRGDAFDSLQLTIHLPADAALTARFLHAQEAALVAGLGWSHARARTKAQEMAHEAEDYLRGSIERGDHEIAGKLEEHLPGGVDIGAIHTKSERTFLLLNVD